MRRAAALVVAALLVAGCGSSPSEDTAATATQAEPQPLTLEQAELLASAQYLNYRNEGAEFTMVSGVSGTGSSFTIEGQIDWSQLIGYGVVTPEQGEPYEVWWREDIVVQSAPELSTLLAAADQPPVFVGHGPNPAARPLDKAIATLLELGATRRDNPLLVRQKEGSAYLGEGVVDETPTVILRFGEINRFWIDPQTGLMLRFEGNSSAGKAPVLVDLLTHEAQRITAPPGQIVNEEQAREIAASYGLGG